MNKKSVVHLIFFVLLLLLWSCEDEAADPEPGKKSQLVIKSLLDDTKTSYTFYVDSFVKDDELLYDSGKVNDSDDVKTGKDWGKVILRWGFRKKSSARDNKVYWVQSTKSDQDSQNSYPNRVREEDKARFIPDDLPEALLNEDAIEIYVVGEYEGQKVSRAIGLPRDFKEKVLGATVVTGMIFNKTARDEGRSEGRLVEGAAVFLVHHSSGRIFQTFSDKKGKFRATVRYKNSFYLVTLRKGFSPFIRGISLPEDKETNIINLSESSEIEPQNLYELGTKDGFKAVSGSTGYSVTGMAVDTDPKSPTSGKGLVQTFLLLFDRDFSSTVVNKVYFLESSDSGSFTFNVPTTATKTQPTTLSVAAAAYGYLPTRNGSGGGSERIGENGRTAEDILGTVGFERNSAFDPSPVMAWKGTSAGGPSNFAYLDEQGKETSIPLHYSNTAVTVNLRLEAKGIFLPASPTVTWKLNDVASSNTGSSTSFSFNAAGEYSISAAVSDIRGNQTTLTRVFNLASRFTGKPDDPAVRVQADSIVGGSITSTNTAGTTVVSISPSASEVYLVPEVSAVDPDTGTDRGVIYRWTVTINERTNTVVGQKPLNLRLLPGNNNVTLEVVSADGNNTKTITKIYAVGKIS